ncbi:hypothetical protein ZWY2020_021183 [Hordeum vulgare]|nr:hypothetical protein ZWY2020_021183 [Hordeum vulgare]
MDGGGVRPAPIQPAAAGGGAAGPDEPRDTRVVRELLRSMGLGEGEYEARRQSPVRRRAWRREEGHLPRRPPMPGGTAGNRAVRHSI